MPVQKNLGTTVGVLVTGGTVGGGGSVPLAVAYRLAQKKGTKTMDSVQFGQAHLRVTSSTQAVSGVFFFDDRGGQVPFSGSNQTGTLTLTNAFQSIKALWEASVQSSGRLWGTDVTGLGVVGMAFKHPGTDATIPIEVRGGGAAYTGTAEYSVPINGWVVIGDVPDDFLLNNGIPLVGAFNQQMVPLLSEALVSISSSAPLFANAPVGAKTAVVTFRAAGVTLTFDATAAVAGSTGIDYAAGTYSFTFRDQTEMKRTRAVQNGGTTTGYVVYWG